MKYLLYELHLAQNMDGTSNEELDKLNNQCTENAKKYNEVFNTLSDRLPQEIFNRFNSYGFHDYRLIKMEIEHKSLLHSSIHFTVSSDDVWILSFDNVSFFQLQHLNYDNDKPIYNREIDDWLYEEVIPISESTLSFEVIFSSGGNILLHFPDKSVSMKKLK
ncbi:hypothetical protein ACTHO0_19420 [Cytobacillus praedii]|uniref:hypothetical protein n=1 Tax=Cytobacillus praedii TaxID=1742358 RepID=UPI003F7DD10F